MATYSPDPACEPTDERARAAAEADGYLQQVDLLALARAARANGVAVRLRPVAGEWVGKGTTVAWAWRPDGRAPVADEASRIVHRSIHLGGDRTESGDLAYGDLAYGDLDDPEERDRLDEAATLARRTLELGHHPAGEPMAG